MNLVSQQKSGEDEAKMALERTLLELLFSSYEEPDSTDQRPTSSDPWAIYNRYRSLRGDLFRQQMENLMSYLRGYEARPVHATKEALQCICDLETLNVRLPKEPPYPKEGSFLEKIQILWQKERYACKRRERVRKMLLSANPSEMALLDGYAIFWKEGAAQATRLRKLYKIRDAYHRRGFSDNFIQCNSEDGQSIERLTSWSEIDYFHGSKGMRIRDDESVVESVTPPLDSCSDGEDSGIAREHVDVEMDGNARIVGTGRSSSPQPSVQFVHNGPIRSDYQSILHRPATPFRNASNDDAENYGVFFATYKRDRPVKVKNETQLSPETRDPPRSSPHIKEESPSPERPERSSRVREREIKKPSKSERREKKERVRAAKIKQEIGDMLNELGVEGGQNRVMLGEELDEMEVDERDEDADMQDVDDDSSPTPSRLQERYCGAADQKTFVGDGISRSHALNPVGRREYAAHPNARDDSSSPLASELAGHSNNYQAKVTTSITKSSALSPHKVDRMQIFKQTPLDTFLFEIRGERRPIFLQGPDLQMVQQAAADPEAFGFPAAPGSSSQLHNLGLRPLLKRLHSRRAEFLHVFKKLARARNAPGTLEERQQQLALLPRTVSPYSEYHDVFRRIVKYEASDESSRDDDRATNRLSSPDASHSIPPIQVDRAVQLDLPVHRSSGKSFDASHSIPPTQVDRAVLDPPAHSSRRKSETSIKPASTVEQNPYLERLKLFKETPLNTFV